MSLPTLYNSPSGRPSLKKDLNAVIETPGLSLSELHKHYLRSRWLEQVLRLERQVNRANNRYYALRLMTVVGSLLILMLVSLKIDDPKWGSEAGTVRYVTIILSLLVCISVALEHLFDYGKRKWQSERLMERLKTEGWRFLQLSGYYRHYQSYAEAFPVFVNHIENLSQRDVEVYITEAAQSREAEKPSGVAVKEAPNTLPVELPRPESEPPMSTRATLRDQVARRLNRHQAR